MQIDVHGHAVWCHSGGQRFDPARPTIVLVHGALNDHSVWQRQSDALARQGYAVLAPDLPGHGASRGAALASVEALAGWLLDLLHAANVERAVLAGHSMGALVVLEAAARAPQRVVGLALLGAAYPMRVADALLAAARDDEDAAIEMVAGWSHTRETEPAIVDASRRLMRRLAGANPAQLLYTDLAACNAYANGEAAAAAVTCPVTLVMGSKDKMTPPRAAARLTAALPHAGLVTVEAGHAMLAEAPEAVLAALKSLADSGFSR